MKPHWTQEILQSRIQDAKQRTRHAGGSPNADEIATYANYLPASRQDALVLGMTPELRKLATLNFESVSSIDQSEKAVALYQDWLPSELAAKETIFRNPWFDLPQLAEEGLRAQVIFGDGVFANLPTLAAQRDFLRLLFGSFPGATIITRKALVADRKDRSGETIESLAHGYRQGHLDDDEFGFGARLIGFVQNHYDEQQFQLNNALGFQECDQLHAAAKLTDEELVLINRYRFEGTNCILTTQAWETLLTSLGCTFEKTILTGKIWYPIYPVYSIQAPTLTE